VSALSLDGLVPQARLLSNGRYTVLLTAAGGGFSAWGETTLTAWDGDRVEDADGLFIYLRDLDDGRLWSAASQPCGGAADAQRCEYGDGRMRIERRTHGIASSLEVCVAAADDVELRRVTVRNTSDRPRRIEITTYSEIILTTAAAFAAHPAFAKLFVQTELVDGVAVARRRPRSASEHPPGMAQALYGPGQLEIETDRARFVGRNRSPAAPAVFDRSQALSGTLGSVLDPIFALRRSTVVPPGADATWDLATAAAADPDAARALVTAAAERGWRDRAFAAAATRAREQCAAHGWSAAQGAQLQALAGRVLYGDPALRADAAVVRRARGAVAQIWAYAFGNRPLVVVELHADGDRARLGELLRARAYLADHGVVLDLLVICDSGALRDAVAGGVKAGGAGTTQLRARGELAGTDYEVLLASAAMVWRPDSLTRATSGARSPSHPRMRSAYPGGRAAASTGFGPEAGGGVQPAAAAPEALRFDNGCGGFSADGSEYVIRVGGANDAAARPPLAWINVVANPHAGFLVSESGAGYTWSRNSREHRLTPWCNDPIRDPHGEALYLRDEDADVFWSPQPGPVPDAAPYEVRHGFGYTRWRHLSQGIDQEVVQFVARDDPVKITRLRLTNRGDRARRISLFAYQRLVLGVTPRDSTRYIVTERDAGSGALLAGNRVNAEFSHGEVFAAAVAPAGTAVSWTSDRAAFIGRHGSAAAPAAVTTADTLDGAVGVGLDPCLAHQVRLELASGQSIECAFLLGECDDRGAVRQLLTRFADAAAIDAALDEVTRFWRDTLSAVQVATPAPAIDVMVNGWLLYQAMSCRLWGRSALYQSGGAFGFRDQLQDSAALVYTRPDLTRAQILLHAAHQFVEGDVLHWWHPPLSRGIRTRFSDDLLWLPYVTAFYLRTTGDWSVLDAEAGFMKTRPLAEGEDEAYLLPEVADEVADVYTHCCRALDRSLARGEHGLPLMGTGDWNDGMNRVGREGRGESVWVGFFLYDTLAAFAPICERRGDHDRARRYATHRAELGKALNGAGWDGAWYRRAYYDDGTPLGSAANSECRIDALAQAWAVISGAAPSDRAAQALEAVETQLVVHDPGLIRLLTPPFDRDPHDPGYIKGYVPGIRENGGQYTHAATWVVRAFAELGNRARAAAYLEMISPASHARTAAQLAVYQVEPYVVVADIYGVAPHLGRGGWTWYTGSASWLYRVAVESVLGVQVEGGDTLVLGPCIPDHWPRYSVRLRRPGRGTTYAIEFENPNGTPVEVVSARVDHTPAPIERGRARIPMVDDGALHQVVAVLGAP
jgi:cyclic beta-1,2-glucan synthetase